MVKVMICTFSTCQQDQKWECEDIPCAGECATFGETHYKTFDGKEYQFLGDCEYVMVKDKNKDNAYQQSFYIIVENLQCGNTGVTCAKSVKFVAGEQGKK